MILTWLLILRRLLVQDDVFNGRGLDINQLHGKTAIEDFASTCELIDYLNKIVAYLDNMSQLPEPILPAIPSQDTSCSELSGDFVHGLDDEICISLLDAIGPMTVDRDVQVTKFLLWKLLPIGTTCLGLGHWSLTCNWREVPFMKTLSRPSNSAFRLIW